MDENIEAVAESAAGTESSNDDIFENLFEGEDFEPQEEDPFEEKAEELPKEEPPEEEKKEEAESEEGEAESAPEMISFVEHGKDFSIPKEAAEGFAKALGIGVDKLIDIYQKGCAFDTQKEKLEAAKGDAAVIEKLAQLRGITANDLRNEISAQIEKIPLDNAVKQIKAEFPGIPESAAQELAKARIGKEEEKPSSQEPETDEKVTEEKAARLREVQLFVANHAAEGITDLPNEVIDIWEKSGISLEKAYESFKNSEKVKELEKKIAAFEKEKAMEKQKNYAKEHSSGSASSAAGQQKMDEFIEGLFKTY